MKVTHMMIYQYFIERLGQMPEDGTLADLPIDTPCGEDCKRAIDRARAMIESVADAFGTTDDFALEANREIISIAQEIVTTFWRG